MWPVLPGLRHITKSTLNLMLFTLTLSVCAAGVQADDEPNARLTPLTALNLSKSWIFNASCFALLFLSTLREASWVLWVTALPGKCSPWNNFCKSLQQQLNENSRSADEEIIACRNETGGFLSDLDERYVGRQRRSSTVWLYRQTFGSWAGRAGRQVAVCFLCFY